VSAPIEREKGLYQNGRLWWIRVKCPVTGAVVPRSTGQSELPAANDRARFLRTAAEIPALHEFLARIVRGDATLNEVYLAHAAGRLHILWGQIVAKQEAEADADLSPWVDRWEREHLAARDITELQRATYVRQVRRLIPEGAPFPKSRLTEDFVKAALLGLTDERMHRPASPSTKRRHVVAWQLFVKFARKRVPLAVNPFEDADDWIPRNSAPRSTFWDHATVRDVLDRMEGEARVMMTLVFGTGLELGAVLGLEGRHVSRTGEQLITVPSDLKNRYRDDRTVFVSDWAWPTVRDHAASVLPRASLWASFPEGRAGEQVREAFYAAQVAAGVTNEPPRSPKTGKKLWAEVAPHTIHDARHTYCLTKLLGLDGEPRQDLKFCAGQLGHADEQMVMRIYSKANVRERLKLIELRDARNQGKGAANAAGGK
jgi:integrase